ncbi:MAG TPA: zinc ribbon domain-containing protein [Methanospirillum sp.]|nr:zinc ribbon domain-containing protein [Methanospirillum sp.]
MPEPTPTCQSCGMPIGRPEDLGTEADGGQSMIYCAHCYQNGQFTAPDASIDEMATMCAPIMTEMFGMPEEKAKNFVLSQLHHLYRWSGKIIQICESCGMPLGTPEDCGTEADGSKSSKYCVHCFQNGSFTKPDLTREEMITSYAPMFAGECGVTVEKAEDMIRRFTAALPRWK